MSRDMAMHRIPMIVSAVVALILGVLPLPHWADVARPDFLVIVVLYWSVMSPRAGGLLLAFIAGLALDATKGIVLGQHALALTLVTAIAINLHLRIRVFPILHQALTIFMLLVIYQFVVFYVDGASGHAVNTLWRWLPCFTGAALWPVFAGVLGFAYQRT